MSLPITSDISDVAVFSKMAKPMPCNPKNGYTSHRTDSYLLRKNNGVDVNAVMIIATIMVLNRCFRIFVINYYTNKLKISENMYETRGTSANSLAVGFT